MSRKWLSLLLIVVLVVSAVGIVAAQSDSETNEAAQRPALGVTVVPDDAGARIVTVQPGSPAAAAGLQVGDVITALNGEVVTAESLASMLQQMQVGEEVTLSAIRGDESLDVSATLGGADEIFSAPLPGVPFLQRLNQPYLGVRLQNTDEGVRIVDVAEGSPAEEAGLLADDIIVSINDTAVSTIREAQEAIAALRVGDSASLTVRRGEEELTLEVTLERTPLSQMNMRFGNRFGLSYDGTNWSIDELAEDSPLYEAGLRAGDILNTIDGEPFDPAAVMNAVTSAEEGASLTLNVTRNDESLDIEVPASALTDLFGGMMFRFDRGLLPPMFEGRRNGGRGPFSFDFGTVLGGGARLGVSFVTLDEQTAAEHNVAVTEGALITDVQTNSPAANAGLQAGDIVTAVDGDTVDVERTLRDRLLAYEPGDVVTLDVLREGETMRIEVTLGQSETFTDLLPFFEQNGPLFRFYADPVPGAPSEQVPAGPRL